MPTNYQIKQRQLNHLTINGFMNQLEPLISGINADTDIRMVKDYCPLLAKTAAARASESFEILHDRLKTIN